MKGILAQESIDFLITLKVNQFSRENMIDASIITSCIVRKYVTEIFIIIRIINIKSVAL